MPLSLSLLALLSVVALVAGDQAWSRASYASARLDAQEAQIRHLFDELDSLVGMIRDDHDDYEHHVDTLELRLETIKGNDCDDDEFSCGRKSGQCISGLLVCDGHDDCENGHDEDHDHVCENVVPVGRAWSGRAHWSGCRLHRENHVSVIITGNEENEDFKERLWVDAVIIETFTEDHHEITKTFATHGYYNYANRHLELDPPENTNRMIGMSCHDAGEGLADCTFIRYSDDHHCGHALLSRSD